MTFTVSRIFPVDRLTMLFTSVKGIGCPATSFLDDATRLIAGSIISLAIKACFPYSNIPIANFNLCTSFSISQLSGDGGI